jgi:hypothetical protein
MPSLPQLGYTPLAPSRLVRDTLSFSKKVENHIGAIKFFICHYNLEKAAALPDNHLEGSSTEDYSEGGHVR